MTPTIPTTPAPTPDLATPRRLAVAALLLAAAFAALAGARPLSVPDEGRYAEVAREMTVTGDWVTPQLDFVPFLDKPPLFSWLEAATFRALGVGPFQARLPAALLGALGCVAALAAGAALGGWRAGLAGALVLAASPLWDGGAQYVNHDLAVAAWITAATLALAVGLRPADRPRAGLVLAGGVAIGLAVLTKGIIGALFPLGVVGPWLLATGRLRRLPWLALAALVGLLVAAPWFVACQAANPDFFHYFFVVQHFERFAGSGFNNPTGPGFYPAVLAAGLLPWSPFLPAAAARAWRRWRAAPADAGGDLLLLLWPVVVVAFFSIPRSKIVGYVLPAAPPLAMLVGRWWSAWGDGAAPPPRPRTWGTAVAGMALLGLAALALPLAAPALDPGRPPLPAVTAALLLATGLLLLAAAGAALAAHRAGDPRRALRAQLAFAAILVAGLTPAVPGVVGGTTDRLAARLRPLLRPGDAVAAYRRWYYDLPVLLDRPDPLLAVDDWDDPAIPARDDWRRELWLGRGWRPGSAAWLAGPAALAGRCAPAGARCFVVAPRDRVAELRRALPLVEVEAQGAAVLLATPAAAPPGPGP